MWLTAEWGADVDASGPHVGLIRVTETVVEGDEDAAGGKHERQDQQAQNQTVQGNGGLFSRSCQNRNHYTHTKTLWLQYVVKPQCITLYYHSCVVQLIFFAVFAQIFWKKFFFFCAVAMNLRDRNLFYRGMQARKHLKVRWNGPLRALESYLEKHYPLQRWDKRLWPDTRWKAPKWSQHFHW